MTPKAILYLHGFNSASLDNAGHLLVSKNKLLMMRDFCEQKGIVFDAPNVDYRDFRGIVESMLQQRKHYIQRSYEVVFMGSSMGGFASEYLAMLTAGKAIMINPAISPTALLPQFIGVAANYETGQPYSWMQAHCEQYAAFEKKLAEASNEPERTILLDMGDELIAADKTVAKYKGRAKIVSFAGGSHSFEHMKQALPEIERVMFGSRGDC